MVFRMCRQIFWARLQFFPVTTWIVWTAPIVSLYMESAPQAVLQCNNWDEPGFLTVSIDNYFKCPLFIKKIKNSLYICYKRIAKGLLFFQTQLPLHCPFPHPVLALSTLTLGLQYLLHAKRPFEIDKCSWRILGSNYECCDCFVKWH